MSARKRIHTPRRLAIALSACLILPFLCGFAGSIPVYAQEDPDVQPSPSASPIPVHEDPTSPVLFNVRNEYRNLEDGNWANTFIFRFDRLVLRNLKNEGGAKGLLLRFDVPFNTVHQGETTESGLGDLYAQVLYIPRINKSGAIAIGTGVTLPTATDTRLGRGKLILSPAVAPVWYSPSRNRTFFIRFQNYFSVAGKESRPDVNYFVADPTLIHRIDRKWWTVVNSELRWDWKTKRHSGIIGIQFGRMLRGKYGFWIKPEIPYGGQPAGNFNLKLTVFRVRSN